MYDMHYDLLTILYYNYQKDNKYADMNKLIKDCKIRYSNNNIIGGLANLYFASIDEMYDELGITKEELLDVKTMLEKSTIYLEDMKKKGVIPKDIDLLYSIEGCDYLDSYKDLEDLYKLGLRSIMPSWNNKNKFASGNRSNAGLTEEGKKLIEKAIELGIIIDISHANKQSFNDILDILEKHNNYNLIASHSNVRTICNKERNLDDEQIIRLRDMNGYIGIVTYGNFLYEDNTKDTSYQKREEMFIKHLDYLINNLNYPIDRIFISTDDMNFHPESQYHHLEAFPIKDISKNIHKSISTNFNEEIANKILIDNPRSIINKVR